GSRCRRFASGFAGRAYRSRGEWEWSGPRCRVRAAAGRWASHRRRARRRRRGSGRGASRPRRAPIAAPTRANPGPMRERRSFPVTRSYLVRSMGALGGNDRPSCDWLIGREHADEWQVPVLVVVVETAADREPFRDVLSLSEPRPFAPSAIPWWEFIRRRGKLRSTFLVR